MLKNKLTSAYYDVLWLVTATVLVSVIMFFFGLWGSDGHLAPALDDTFIHLQYAHQLASGHPFEYNTGDPPSSGDSAFIFPFLLAPAYVLGADSMTPLIYAHLLNLFAHIVMVILLYKLTSKLFGRFVALAVTCFVLLDGRLNWGFATGMETGVYTSALVAFFYAWVQGIPKQRFTLLAFVGTLVALLRPEGHIIISIVSLALLVSLGRNQGFRRMRMAAAWLVLPMAVGLIPYAMNIALTGYWQFNTAASKSLLYIPYMPLHQKLSLMAGYFITMMKDINLGLDVGRSPFPLLITIPVTIAGIWWAFMKFADGPRKLLNFSLVTTLVVGTGLALLLPPTHFYRYYQPYDFIIWLYFSCGLAWGRTKILQIMNAPKVDAYSANFYSISKRSISLWLIGLVSLLMLPQFISYFFILSNSTRDIYYQQMAFSDWIRRYTPIDARIGVNDVGAHKYLSDRYIIDIVGLTHNSLRGAHFSGWGSIYDILLGMPEKERPAYLLIHPDIVVNNIGESVSQSLLSPQYTISIQNPTITAGPREVLYKIDWGYALLDGKPTYLLQKGEMPIDTLNVGYLEDEMSHKYQIGARQPSVSEPKAIVTTSSYEEQGFSMSESGRSHSGWEEFSVRSIPGVSLTLVSRWLVKPDGDQRVLVFADGKEVGLWEAHNERGKMWQEYEYNIPDEFITNDSTSIRLDATFDPGGPGFTSYRYWIYASQQP